MKTCICKHLINGQTTLENAVLFEENSLIKAVARAANMTIPEDTTITHDWQHPYKQEMDQIEIVAAISEAHRLEKRVPAHLELSITLEVNCESPCQHCP